MNEDKTNIKIILMIIQSVYTNAKNVSGNKKISGLSHKECEMIFLYSIYLFIIGWLTNSVVEQ